MTRLIFNMLTFMCYIGESNPEFWRFYIISCLYVVKLLLSGKGRNSETCYSDINCVDFDFFPNYIGYKIPYLIY